MSCTRMANITLHRFTYLMLNMFMFSTSSSQSILQIPKLTPKHVCIATYILDLHIYRDVESRMPR